MLSSLYRRRGLLALSAANVLVLHGCQAADSTGTPVEVDPAQEAERREYLSSYAENVVLATYEQTVELAEELEASLALRAEDPSIALGDAQAAWLELMKVWQRAEVFQVGPGSLSQDYPETGLDLRDQIYSWPFVNACRVDQQLVAEGYQDRSELMALGPNVYGLDALEYLLFSTNEENACAPMATINDDGSWQRLVDSEELPQRRADYALMLGQSVKQHSAALLDAWHPDRGDFVAELAEAGEGNGAYVSAQAALNVVTDGMFYLEKESKDLKLAVPAGLSADCASDVCPDARESRYAEISVPHLERNLEGFQMAYFGGPSSNGSKGLDDLLRAQGEGDLDSEIQTGMQLAFDSLSEIDDPSMALTLVEAPERVRAAHSAFSDLLDLFKTELVEALSLSVPERAASDND